MGANSWYSFTEYDPDPGVALLRLRRRALEAGAYPMHLTAVREFADRVQEAVDSGQTAALSASERSAWRAMQSVLHGATLPPEMRAQLHASLASTGSAQARHRPNNIDDVLDDSPGQGTHSILDIDRVSTGRACGAATALTERDLLHHFGTIRPTHEQAETSASTIAQRLERCEAYYFATYRDGRPEEYIFVGCSGE